MDGIVSLLDNQHRDRVQALWAELEREFGLRGVFAARFPHFSYHVAEVYHNDRLAPILARFAPSHAPLLARTTGLGVFTGERPVLFIPVVRTPNLTRLHQELWWAVDGTTEGTIELYSPHDWVPHITLAHGDLRAEMLPDVIRYLCTRSFTWEMLIDNLVLVTQAGTEQEQQLRFELGPAGNGS